MDAYADYPAADAPLGDRTPAELDSASEREAIRAEMRAAGIL